MRKRLLILAMALVLVLTACGNQDVANEDVETNGEVVSTETGGVLKVGMEAAYPPYNWTQIDDANGAIKIHDSIEYANGYDVKIAKKIADELGMELQITKMSWDGLIPAVNSGNIDLIIAGMNPTPERREQIDFTIPYYYTEITMMTMKDSPYSQAKTIQDFEGAKVSAQLGTSHYNDMAPQLEGATIDTPMEDFPLLRVALESGSIDAYVSEYPESISATSANENFQMIRFEEGNGFVIDGEENTLCIGIKKDSALTDRVNSVLEGISKEEMDELIEETVKNQPANIQ